MLLIMAGHTAYSRHTVFRTALLFFCLFCLAPEGWAEDNQAALLSRYDLLQVQTLRAQAVTSEQAKDPAELKKRVQQYFNTQNIDAAAKIVLGNSVLVTRNIVEPNIEQLIRIMAHRQLAGVLLALQEDAETRGEMNASHHLALIRASDFITHGRVDAATNIVFNADFIQGLAGEELAQTLITRAVLLQKQKKHRAAALEYAKVDKKSRYYPLAQFNLATTNIREDWWTDAQIILNKNLEDAGKSQTEWQNRQRLTQGLLSLKKGLYRDGYKQLQKVTQDSQYAPRAILGMGLASLELHKYDEAAKIFTFLKNQPNENTSKIQAYFLAGLTWQSKGDRNKATQFYQDAINFYENKILYYSKIKLDLSNINSPQKVEVPTSPKQQQWQFRIDAAEQLSASAPPQLKAQWQTTLQALRLSNAQATEEFLQAQLDTLNQYLNNSRYGIAHIYDTRPTANP